TSETPYWYIIVIYAVRMFAVALIIMPLNTIGINTLESKNISHGTAIMNSLRIIAGAIGTAIIITIMVIVRTNYSPSTGHTKTDIDQQATLLDDDASFAFSTILLIIGFILTLLIKTKNKAENTREI